MLNGKVTGHHVFRLEEVMTWQELGSTGSIFFTVDWVEGFFDEGGEY